MKSIYRDARSWKMRALIAAAFIASSFFLPAFVHVAQAIDPRHRQETAPEPPQQPRTREPARDYCVQARADWASITTTTDLEVLRSFIRTLPAQCNVQRAQAERRLASLQADAVRPPIRYAPISFGQRVSGALAREDGRLTTDEYVDGYRFMGRAGQRISIEMRSNAFDAYLILIPPSGDQIDVDDAEGMGTNSRVEYALPVDGEYVILATSFQPGEAGDYTLTLSTRAPAPAQISSNAPAPAPSANTLPGPPATGLIWTALPDEQTLARVYPLAARNQRREGRVVLSCRVTIELSAACAIQSEAPAGLGFGAAALEASRVFRIAASQSDGSSSVGTQTEVILNFRLDQIAASPQ